ncbi:MAG: uroporphyrinogen-III C-methyltransferase [Desulfarculaceae bacterium]|nr:uroporphyrinogen-III C-methyltransferase [Desulfarculaceae bacterium]MCF8070971.1 uroporphyrinogen-III C-methyltransferase [Desulfarculaceae bacterium]MCF8100559.1 uroporphyrinogen-III C-methyltransferase [Desulfarculaceae bacterium]MCF8116585.1 uroporphyrinogen-III C-methyltransferase [Desulfarculaceae bacterium]
MSGKIYLIGAGPGDPGLLTLKGAEVLAACQVVVYDYLANPEFLELAPPEAERIYVGKKGGDHTKTQDQINQLLVDLAAQGKIVARLKGGDPFVFGRGGEEASALAARGHAFEVVPGVTSAIAAPAYAGIPVTDRRATTEVAFVTGHEDPTKPGSTINWQALSQIGTVVFLMGVKNLPHICDSLMKAGRDPATPAAAVRWGTTPQQETVSGTLADLAGKVRSAGLKAPAITIVGQVAALRQELAWFEKLPLFGKSVLVTRARKQASRLSEGLKALGARVIEVPTITFRPPDDPEPLNTAIEILDDFHWVIFTSPNGVEAFFEALLKSGRDARALSGCKLAAIGPATAAGLKAHGLVADMTARTFQAEGLIEALQAQGLTGQRVLIPRAAEAREVLPETIAQWGNLVQVVPAYRTVSPEGSPELLAEALNQGLDVITFTASSTVSNLMAMLDKEGQAELARLSQSGQLTVAAIGPITGDTARGYGLEVAVQPESFTIEALVSALTAHFAS